MPASEPPGTRDVLDAQPLVSGAEPSLGGNFRLTAFGSHGARLTIAAYAVALFGVLPPLVHLRERAASPRPSPA